MLSLAQNEGWSRSATLQRSPEETDFRHKITCDFTSMRQHFKLMRCYQDGLIVLERFIQF